MLHQFHQFKTTSSYPNLSPSQPKDIPLPRPTVMASPLDDGWTCCACWRFVFVSGGRDFRISSSGSPGGRDFCQHHGRFLLPGRARGGPHQEGNKFGVEVKIGFCFVFCSHISWEEIANKLRFHK